MFGFGKRKESSHDAESGEAKLCSYPGCTDKAEWFEYSHIEGEGGGPQEGANEDPQGYCNKHKPRS